MSRSAHRLSGDVATGRFHWQTDARPTAPSVDVPEGRQGPAAGHSRLLDAHEMTLPSAIAERTRAVERESYARGVADAEGAAEAAAAARVDPIIRRLIATIDEIAALRVGMMRRTERDLVRLALAMAERIVRRELDQDRELLVVMARVAIDRLGDNVVASVHLNPADFAATAAGREDTSGHAVTIVADPAIPRGGCRVESAFGVIDAGIDTQIRELTRALLGDEHEEDQSHGVAAGA